MTQPILSICIPTYNRADYLDKTLDAICFQEVFRLTDKIEIVISDNCSNDNTHEICQKYIKYYPDKIKYFKNQKNIYDDNYQKVLSYGKGKYLKLLNDTLIFTKDSLKYMVDMIEKNLEEKPLIFFSNGFNSEFFNKRDENIFNNIDELISYLSYQITWIGGFGIWKEDFDEISDFNRYSYLRLLQVDVLLRLALMKKKIIVYSHIFAEAQRVGNKGGYNIAEIFGQNYLKILKEHLKNKTLSKKVYNIEKRRILDEHINPFYFDFLNQYSFKKTGYFKYLKDYWFNLYFYRFYFQRKKKRKIVLCKYNEQLLNEQRLQEQLDNDFNYQWRLKNPHNDTTLHPVSAGKNIIVGNGTYGEIYTEIEDNNNYCLKIGNYCSIANGVKFIVASEHPYNGISTYPFKVKKLGYEHEAIGKGSIIVQDDVWIASNAIILSGVTIGQGAIIGAGAVVTKDVPPYAIVGGNPAKIIKYRFKDEIIEKLLKFDYSGLSDEKIKILGEKLYTELTEDNIDELLKEFQ